MRVLSWQKKLLLGSLVAMGMLLLAEVVARVGSTVQDDLATEAAAPAEWFVYSPTLGWERRPGFRGDAGHAARSFDKDGYFSVDSEEVADTTKKKVVFLGDSNTFGFGVATEASFVEVVEGLLPDVDAINLGVSGYTSYQGRVSLEKYLPLLKPDLVVASFNFNDRRYVLTPDAVDGAETFEEVYRSSLRSAPGVLRWLELSHAFRMFRLGLRRVGLAPKPVAAVEEVQVDAVAPRVDEESYRQNLAFMAEETRRQGVPLIFLLLQDNPIEAYHLREGVLNLEGSVATAVSHLRVAVESGGALSDVARIYLAEAYRRQGKTGEAAGVVISDSPFLSLHGGRPVRQDRLYNDIMRQVARDRAVELVDAGSVLEDHPYVYIDVCHFDAEGHRRVGELLAARIARILSDRPIRRPS